MNTSFFFLLTLAMLHMSCSKPEEKRGPVLEITQEPTVIKSPLTMGDNSQNALDWAGTYFNVMPCASCEGIETWLTLKPNRTFELKTNYLGLNDAREEIFTGTFEWDSSGSTIQLKGLIGDTPGKYKVGENRVWHLDQEGNIIEGALAERYILNKK
jgi:uncharacterized lipoprotein NlpE involved in copper resistance